MSLENGDPEAKMKNAGSTFEVDSEGNAREVLLITTEKILDQLNEQKRGLQGIIDHMSEMRERMIKEGK
jgi:hypothetical protein